MMETAPASEIEELERVGRLTWPALEEDTVDGWLVRAAAGVTRRSNSVNPGAVVTPDLEATVDSAIEWLRIRDLPPIFRLTPASSDQLQPILETRGLRKRPGASIMVRHSLVDSLDADVEMSPTWSEEWMDVLAEQEDRGGSARRIVEQLFDRHALPTSFALIRHEATPTAVGMGVVSGRHIGIFNMRTRLAQRRRGFSRRILGALVSFGAAEGADHAFIQVHPANEAAIALYRSAGFERRYSYWYYQLPD